MSTPLQGWIRGLRALPSPTHASLTSPPIGWPRALLLSPTSATTPTTSWCRYRKAVRVADAYSLLGRTGASTCPSPSNPAPALSSEDELEPDNSSGRVHRTICVLRACVPAPLVLDDRHQRLPTNGASYIHVRLPAPAPVTTLPSNLFMNLLREVAPMARPNYLETEPPSTGKSMPVASSSAGPSRPIGIIFRKHSLANPGLLWRGPN